MRRTLLLFGLVCCCATLLGCGGKPQDLSARVQNATNKSEFPKKDPNKETFEYTLAHAETAEDRAECLRSFANDVKFNPKEHVELLKKYESDSNAEVAAAAKELLAKAQ
jgi:hypothetical protein